MAPQPRRPLEEALETELHRFERATVRVWTIVGAVLLVCALAYAAVVAPLLGLALTVLCAGYLIWYVWLWWRLSKGPPGRALEAAIVVGEIAMPWCAFGLLLATRGVPYAVGSWLPPMVFCGLIVSNAVTLRHRRSMANGIGGAVVYLFLYLVALRDGVGDELAGELLYRPPTHVSRVVSLVIAGAGGALAALALRRVIGRAEVVSRERDLFGKYRLLGKVASGGMGTVHEAVYCPEGGFERRVAVKRIHPHLAEQPRFVEAFRREAALSARLLHPNIVQVMDFGRVDERYFLSMEFVDGVPLSDLSRRARADRDVLSPVLVGHVGREILAGLHYAHRVARDASGAPLRVVHRDMCPQNVLVSRAGEVKISDFGVARALEDGGSALTQTFVGHVGYFAPEQASGEHEIDPRADLFPVGVMLWELLAGRTLFLRSAQGATINAVLQHEPPTITSLRPELDPRWDAFFAGALAKDPTARFASAQRMLAALETIGDAEGDGAEELAAMFVLDPVSREVPIPLEGD